MSLVLEVNRNGNGNGAPPVRVVPATARTQEVRRLAMQTQDAALKLPSFGTILRGAAGLIPGIGPIVQGIIPPPTTFAPTGCPPGFELDPKTGACRKVGFRGGLERILPGGSTGMLPREEQAGQAVIGAFGLPARVPVQAGAIQRRNGTMGAILRCPTGFVLGKDDLCYPKQLLGRAGKFRKHPRPPRAPVTAEDMRCIRRASSASRRVKKLAGDVGFTCRTKGSRR